MDRVPSSLDQDLSICHEDNCIQGLTEHAVFSCSSVVSEVKILSTQLSTNYFSDV